MLDFGSGTGANCAMFKPAQYLGFDPDTRRVDYAKKLYPSYSFQVLKPHQWPVEEQSIDYILIIAVLHHIHSEEIALYMKEFQRVLKPGGIVVAIEPYLCRQHPLCNFFMKRFDRGQYIRHEEDYIALFQQHDYLCTIRNKFRKCFLYNELFISAELSM